MPEPSSIPLAQWALEITRCAADVANYCDHLEHNEVLDRDWVLVSAEQMRRLACRFAQEEQRDLRELYAARLSAVEQRTPLWHERGPDGASLVRAARTWRALQLAQIEHDRFYHPDVIGLPKADQLNHYALHAAKLAGAAATLATGIGDLDDFCARRLPDLLLFGIKLSTVMGHRLPEQVLEAGPNDSATLVAV